MDPLTIAMWIGVGLVSAGLGLCAVYFYLRIQRERIKQRLEQWMMIQDE